MKIVKCSNCHELKEEDNFYWHERENRTLKSRECISCISKKSKKKRQEKKSELNFSF